MTKELYQILEINETATAEEIKKAYRKLAIKWHPDKWMNENLEERQNANDKMQKINKAYEILGDEEKKRRYDLGQDEFAATDDFDLKEWIRREKERFDEEIGEIDDKLEKLKKLAKFLLQRETWSIIWNEMLASGIRPSHLDSNLWTPCNNWGDKIYDIEIGDDENDREGIDRRKINEFKEKMIKAIREKKIQLTAEKVAKASSDLERVRLKVIEEIERELQNRGLKIEDLEEEHHDYEEKINGLAKKFKIHSYEDKVIEAIRRKSQSGISGEFKSKKSDFGWEKEPEQFKRLEGEKKTPFGDDFDKRVGEEPKKIVGEKEFKGSKYDNLTKEELIKKIEKLESEIKELKGEKVEKDELPEFQIILEKKEMELKESKEKLLQTTDSNKKKLEPRQQKNEFPVGLVAGGIGIFIVLGSLVVLIIGKSKKEK